MKINEIIFVCNELDMLEVHLEAHAPFVERFLIAESETTVSGLDKPLFFKENKERFAKWGDKLVHVEIPPDIHSRTTGWSDFRIQDHAKNQYVHPIACEGADYVQHSDCDEILYPMEHAIGLNTLEAHPDWLFACYKLRQSKTYVNCIQKKVNVYRYVKANKDGYLLSPKGQPRGATVTGAAGWHFHNCFSSVDELYWKVLNRNWMFGGWDNVPTREQCELVWNRLGSIYTITKDEVPQIDEIRSSILYDEPELMKARAQPMGYLPLAMQDRIERFPYYA